MMDGIAGYIMRIVAVTLIISIVRMLIKNDSAEGGVVRLVGGIVLVLTIVVPLRDWDLSSYEFYLSGIEDEAQDAIKTGREAAENGYRTEICKQLEKLIVIQAERVGAKIDVSINEFDPESFVPEGALITGIVTPYQKSVLTDYLKNDLGISGENIIWE